jgi:S-adenosylmethionine/arginine decarboxylase-like enzyme
MKPRPYWGYHLMLDCSNCHRPSIKDKSSVDQFIKHLLKMIDMKPIGEPIIEYTAGEFPDKAGLTAIQIIVTSTIVAHFIDSTGDLYLDVFSCKEFDVNVVEDVVKQCFLPEYIRANFITRQAG